MGSLGRKMTRTKKGDTADPNIQAVKVEAGLVKATVIETTAIVLKDSQGRLRVTLALSLNQENPVATFLSESGTQVLTIGFREQDGPSVGLYDPTTGEARIGFSFTNGVALACWLAEKVEVKVPLVAPDLEGLTRVSPWRMGE